MDNSPVHLKGNSIGVNGILRGEGEAVSGHNLRHIAPRGEGVARLFGSSGSGDSGVVFH